MAVKAREAKRKETGEPEEEDGKVGAVEVDGLGGWVGTCGGVVWWSVCQCMLDVRARGREGIGCRLRQAQVG